MMAKRREELKTSWPYLAAGAVVAVVAVLAVVSQNGSVETTYGEVAATADKVADFRAAQKAAESDVYTHDKMADFHAQRAESATTISEQVNADAKMAVEKVQEGTASVRENFNGALADHYNGEMQDTISATLPVSQTVQ